MGVWYFGAAMGLLAFLGLVMASFATSGVFYGTGLALFAFGFVAIFWLIRRGTAPSHD